MCNPTIAIIDIYEVLYFDMMSTYSQLRLHGSVPLYHQMMAFVGIEDEEMLLEYERFVRVIRTVIRPGAQDQEG